MIRPWWSKGKDIGCPTRLKCCRNMILLRRHFLGNPIWYMLVQRAYSAATHTTTANAYEQSKRRGEHVGRIRLRILRFLRTSGGQSHIALTIVYVLLVLFSFFFFFYFRFFSRFLKKTWNLNPLEYAKDRVFTWEGCKKRILSHSSTLREKKKRKNSAQNFSLQYVNLASICWTISRPWGGLERVCWTNANAYHHAIAFHGMACQKIILHLTVGAGSGGKRITKWQKIIFWAAGLRTTWETCKETKKTRVSYVNHRWEPTSKKIRVRVPQASAMEKNIAPKNGHDVSIRVGWTPLALLRGSCAKFRHPRREKNKSCASC